MSELGSRSFCIAVEPSDVTTASADSFNYMRDLEPPASIETEIINVCGFKSLSSGVIFCTAIDG